MAGTFANIQGNDGWTYWASGDREYLVRPWTRGGGTIHCWYLVVKVDGDYSEMHDYTDTESEALALAERWDTMTDDEIRGECPAPGWLPASETD